jgi:hypothetical protein
MAEVLSQQGLGGDLEVAYFGFMRPQAYTRGGAFPVQRSAHPSAPSRRAIESFQYGVVHEPREEESPAGGAQAYTITLGLLAFSITAILMFAPVLGHLLGRVASLLPR